MTEEEFNRASKARKIDVYHLNWNGISLEIRYERDWMGFNYLSHLEVEAIEPRQARLPISNTGYISHYLSPMVIEDIGGAVGYVTVWLDDAADGCGPVWRDFAIQ